MPWLPLPPAPPPASFSPSPPLGADPFPITLLAAPPSPSLSLGAAPLPIAPSPAADPSPTIHPGCSPSSIAHPGVLFPPSLPTQGAFPAITHLPFSHTPAESAPRDAFARSRAPATQACSVLGPRPHAALCPCASGRTGQAGPRQAPVPPLRPSTAGCTYLPSPLSPRACQRSREVCSAGAKTKASHKLFPVALLLCCCYTPPKPQWSHIAQHRPVSPLGVRPEPLHPLQPCLDFLLRVLSTPL